VSTPFHDCSNTPNAPVPQSVDQRLCRAEEVPARSTQLELHRELVRAPKSGVLRFAAFFAGLVFVALGAIGAVVPGLPTTPFVLLACWCFSRSSKRLELALLRSRLFGPLIADWRQHRAIRREVRSMAIGMVVAMTIATCFFSSLSYSARSIIAAFACIGLLVVLRLPILSAARSGPQGAVRSGKDEIDRSTPECPHRCCQNHVLHDDSRIYGRAMPHESEV